MYVCIYICMDVYVCMYYVCMYACLWYTYTVKRRMRNRLRTRTLLVFNAVLAAREAESVCFDGGTLDIVCIFQLRAAEVALHPTVNTTPLLRVHRAAGT